MSDSDDEHEFTVSEWISMIRISEDGAKRLEKFAIGDLATLMLFRESDVESLKLSLTDSLRFRDGIAKLHAVSDIKPALIDDQGKVIPTPVKPPVVPVQSPDANADVNADAKVYSLKDVERLLAGREAVSAGSGIIKKVEPQGLSGVAALANLLCSEVRCRPLVWCVKCEEPLLGICRIRMTSMNLLCLNGYR
jgi:hypothetical protein